MTSLPTDLPQRLQNANTMRAYNICLTRERSLQSSIKEGNNVGRDLIYIRTLGYLILHAPTEIGRENVTLEILSASKEAILDLGKMYYDHFIRAFRSNKGRVPTPSTHASRPSFDTIADMVNKTLEEAPQSHSTARKHALIRDRYHCVVTGLYDSGSVDEIKELEDMVNTAEDIPGLVYTHCMHILAGSVHDNIEPGLNKWDIMRKFGYTDLPDELKGIKIHRLENVLTVSSIFHELFAAMKIWLVATDTPNKYKLEAVKPPYLRPYPHSVTLTTLDPIKFPVPSSVYLAIHAACAKVAHFSGAAAYIDKLERGLVDSTTLDSDGASGDLLEHAIAKLQVANHPVLVGITTHDMYM